MKHFSIVLLLAAASLVLPVSATAHPQEAACDRQCLAQRLDNFLQAVVARDPDLAGLWVGFRQTQNAVLTAPSEGIWTTMTGIGKVDNRYYDPETGQAEFFGTIEEGDATGIAALRIKVQYGKVTEAEWNIARRDSPGSRGGPVNTMFSIETLESRPPATRVVPLEDRRPREELIAAANSYFDGIQSNTGRHVLANPGCTRLENGQGASAEFLSQVLPQDADFLTRSDCRAGYDTLEIRSVAARRYLMVDEEAQVVVASVVFLRAPLSTRRRNYFTELFYMDGGKISAVYAAMHYADPDLPVPNWPPYDGNFAIPPDFVPHG